MGAGAVSKQKYKDGAPQSADGKKVGVLLNSKPTLLEAKNPDGSENSRPVARPLKRGLSAEKSKLSGTSKEQLTKQLQKRELVRQTLLAEAVASTADVGSPKGPKLNRTMSGRDSGSIALPTHLQDVEEMAYARIQEVDAELTNSIQESLEERRRIYRALCLLWHKSRRDGTPEERWAGKVYRHIMDQRDWFLDTEGKNSGGHSSPTQAHLRRSFSSGLQ